MERDDIHRTRTSFSQVSGKDASNDEFLEDNSCINSNVSVKRTRLDGNEWHSVGDSFNTFPGHFLQEQGVSSSHHRKERSLWNNMLFDSEHGSGINSACMVNERECGQIAPPNLVSHHDVSNTGGLGERSVLPLSMGNCFDFLQTNTNGGCRSSSLPTLSWHNSTVLMPQFTAAESIAHSFQADARRQTNLLSSMEQSSECIRGKASVLDQYYPEQNRIARVNTDNMSGNSSNSVSGRIPLLPSQGENDEQRLLCNGSGLITRSKDAMPNERRNDLKRKLSPTGTSDPSLVEDSQSTGWNMNTSIQAEIGLGGRIRPLSQPSPNQSNANHPIIQVWDDFAENRTGLTSSNLSIGHVRNSIDVVSTSGVHPDGFLRPLEDNKGLLEEHHDSQPGSLFGRNFCNSAGPSNSPGLYTRDLSYMERRIAGSGGSTINDQSSLCRETSATSTNVATCGLTNHYNRHEMIPRFFVRESTSNVNGNRVSGVTNRFTRVVRRAVLDNNSGNRAISPQIPDVSAARMTNALERGDGILFPGPNGSLYTTLPYSQNSTTSNGTANLMPSPPPMVSNRPALVGATRLPRTSSVQLLAGHAASFMDGRREGVIQRARIQNLLGLPMANPRMPYGDRQRLISEILSTLQHASRNDDINFEELVMFDPSFIYQGIEVRDQHSDLRLDIDNMSYEELLALGERIGDVNTGLTNEMITACLRESKYSSLDATLATLSLDSDAKCSICQEEFVEGDEVGRLDCGHGYHTSCIKQWLLLKNLCPICKASAYSKC